MGAERIWIFQSKRNFTPQEEQLISAYLEKFLPQWNAHGEKLESSYHILLDRFIKIETTDSQVKASGCAIDAMTRVIKEIEENLRVGLLDRMLISYQSDDKEIKTVSLPVFKNLVKNKELHGNDEVFNLSLTSEEEFQEKFKQKIKDSWASTLL